MAASTLNVLMPSVNHLTARVFVRAADRLRDEAWIVSVREGRRA
ncbi:MAG: hypothetical protein ABI611_05530 [Solirubrobacteraceae bacterium]